MRSLWLLAALTFAACAAKPPTEPPVEEEEVPFDGETTSNLPDFTDGVIDAGANSPVDAGPVVVETRCCQLHFALTRADEPLTATGRLVGEAFPLNEGISLSSADAGFAASACVPINTSSYYWFELEWPTDDADAGGVGLEDGGFVVRVERYDADSLHYSTGTGVPRNFVPAVADCAELDAGTGP